MSAPTMADHCECRDPFHEGKPCPKSLDSVRSAYPGVVSSPALCMGCLFSCEDINGTGVIP